MIVSAVADQLKDFRFSFLICEFDMDDIINFPNNSGIPKAQQSKIKVTGRYEEVRSLDKFITPYNAHKLGLLRRSARTVNNAIKKGVLTEHVHYIKVTGKKFNYKLITEQLNEINRIITH